MVNGTSFTVTRQSTRAIAPAKAKVQRAQCAQPASRHGYAARCPQPALMSPSPHLRPQRCGIVRIVRAHGALERCALLPDSQGLSRRGRLPLEEKYSDDHRMTSLALGYVGQLGYSRPRRSKAPTDQHGGFARSFLVASAQRTSPRIEDRGRGTPDSQQAAGGNSISSYRAMPGYLPSSSQCSPELWHD